MRPFLCRRCVAPYPTRPTRPLERSHCRANPPRTVRVHCEHLLMWSECTGRTRRSGRSVYTGNPPRTVRERHARPVKLSVCTRPNLSWGSFTLSSAMVILSPVLIRPLESLGAFSKIKWNFVGFAFIMFVLNHFMAMFN